MIQQSRNATAFFFGPVEYEAENQQPIVTSMAWQKCDVRTAPKPFPGIWLIGELEQLDERYSDKLKVKWPLLWAL